MRSSWIVPNPRLALLIGAASPVWLLSGSTAGRALAVAVTAVIVIALLYELVTLPSAAAVGVSRTAPERSGLGDGTDLTYSIERHWPRALRLTLYERLPRSIRATRGGPMVLDVDDGHTTERSTVIPLARGVHQLGDVVARLRGSLGLLSRSVRIHFTDQLSVAPSLAPIRRFRLRALQARTREAGPRVLRQRGESLTFSGLRAYVPGDDPRRIDWKATARQRTPILREYNLEQGQTVLIALDAGRLMTQQERGVSRFEQALSSALVLATVAADAGDKVGLLLFDDRVRRFLPPRAGLAAVRAIRDALVGAQPSLVEPDYAAAFATIAARQRRRALVVVFSDVIDARSSRALIAHTTRSTSRHLHVVVTMRSDALFAAGVPSPSADARALYFSAAAEELVLAREEALQRMRRSGASVIDVPASAISASVVDRYLEIKGRGAI